MKVQLLKNQALIADQCLVADSYFARLRGLIGRSGFGSGQGLLFPRCSSIHMWFMRFPIDVVFIRVMVDPTGAPKNYVSSTHRQVKPWKIFPVGDLKARDVLELPAGSIDRHQIEVGDELCIS